MAIGVAISPREATAASTRKAKLQPWQALLIVAGVALSAWLAWGFWFVEVVADHWEPSNTTSDALSRLGQAGDIFGGVNAVFAAAAFVGVAFAGFMQHRQFQILETQHRQQQFEPLFFELLRRVARPTTLRSVGDMKLNVAAYPDGGYDFGEISKALREQYEGPQLKDRRENGKKLDRDFAAKQYLELYGENEPQLGPYYRTLYHVFKMVHFSGLDEEAKVRYANIARSTLSTDELFLLSLNCLTTYGEKFKPLAEELGLLKHIGLGEPGRRSLEDLVVEDLYAETAKLPFDERRNYWRQNPAQRARLTEELAAL